jgi:hypothetical protein
MMMMMMMMMMMKKYTMHTLSTGRLFIRKLDLNLRKKISTVLRLEYSFVMVLKLHFGRFFRNKWDWKCGDGEGYRRLVILIV